MRPRTLSLYFFLLGFVYAAWISRLPDLQRQADLTDSGLGAVLFLAAIGAFLAIFIAPQVIGRVTSRRTVLITGCLYCFLLILMPFGNGGAALGAILFTAGAVSATFDVAINTQAVALERTIGRPIMSALHGMFGLGVALGGVTAAILGAMPVEQHLLIIGPVSLLLCLGASGGLTRTDPAAAGDQLHGAFLPTPFLRAVAVVMFCALLAEGAIAEWCTKFFREQLDASPSTAPIGLAGFSAGMLIGRFMGDRARHQYGDIALVRYGSLLSAALFAAALICAAASPAIALFVGVGLALSVIVPVCFSAAGAISGVRSDIAISQLTSIGYAGLMVGPPVIGFLSDQVGLRGALGVIPLVMIIAAAAMRGFPAARPAALD